jgi:hypothetical protein
MVENQGEEILTREQLRIRYSICSSCQQWHAGDCKDRDFGLMKCPKGKYIFIATKHFPNKDVPMAVFPEQWGGEFVPPKKKTGGK